MTQVIGSTREDGRSLIPLRAEAGAVWRSPLERAAIGTRPTWPPSHSSPRCHHAAVRGDAELVLARADAQGEAELKALEGKIKHATQTSS